MADPRWLRPGHQTATRGMELVKLGGEATCSLFLIMKALDRAPVVAPLVMMIFNKTDIDCHLYLRNTFSILLKDKLC